MLVRLFYKAQCSVPPSDTQDQQISAQAQGFNAAHEITGFLLRCNTHYYQILEGDDSDVLPLAERIRGDSRLSNYTLLSSRDIQQRLFHDWAMTCHRLDHSDVGLRDRLRALQQHASPDTAAAIGEVALLAVQKYKAQPRP